MDVPDVSPFPAWVSCVNIPNMVQLRSSKMADGKALSSVSSDNEEPEQHQRDSIQTAIEKGADPAFGAVIPAGMRLKRLH